MRESPETRTILSSTAKDNFAKLVDDVYAHGTRYIVTRFDIPRAVLISLSDFQKLLLMEQEQDNLVHENRGTYQLGTVRSDKEIAELVGLIRGGK